ncbi:MAG: polysaccharide biosynthesis protein [Anaeromicrobium sp.]|jgi:FlaA1/EpsC-like NDP-sugar epimerase|uniref:polysaccharide biosynthesis protein n=1 Tax=Anaeromicrobium sp. TaxID=1929132 RepID=UPI0025E228A0|nr:nucleoside-diphosphate sugar epimerase/dehydratase [Anaeromicrobium sp.]MCT4593975.1 polysaccharide biosynthesis protein [Anaeromicrobium sp.]
MHKKFNIILVLLIDMILINGSIMMAYYLRFGTKLTFDYFKVFLHMSLFITAGKIMLYYYFGLYKSIWKYAGIDELMNLFMAVSISNGFIIIVIYLAQLKVPRSIYVITFFIDIFLFGISRFNTKIFQRINLYYIIRPSLKSIRKRAMIIGAGEAGNILLQQFKNNQDLGIKTVCFIDDDLMKKGRKIAGVPVIGTRKDIVSYAENMKIDEIIIAIPSGKNSEISKIIDICRETKCNLKILPNIHELRECKGDMRQILIERIRRVEVSDLLGRENIQMDREKVLAHIKDKIILVTGGGGSIGSELCRQIIKYNPKKLIILDINENNLYDVEYELSSYNNKMNYECIVGSVRDNKKLEYVFNKYKPQIVFHAAAHKHVPLMEIAPEEAIKNNVFGTLNLVKNSDKYKVEKFILISSDKAVNPTNVMGTSKRICEMIVQAYNNESNTDYVAVRFGNVLCSRGSVIPLFKRQIEKGGPVTVTHPDIIRYFMTIPEAVGLVMECASLAQGGEIFILDMGQPVKIDDLARNLITLSGFEPDKDIKIVYTGLRPGEKLFEELLINGNDSYKTENDKIYIEKPSFINYDTLKLKISKLKYVLDKDKNEIKSMLKNIVPEYNFQCDKKGESA